LQNAIPIALEKIDNGTFGECEIWAQEIAAGILARKLISRLCGYCDRMHLR
jgi:hypothetical protein